MISVLTLDTTFFITSCATLFDVTIKALTIVQEVIFITNEACLGVAFRAIAELVGACRTKCKIIVVLLSEESNVTFAALRLLVAF